MIVIMMYIFRIFRRLSGNKQAKQTTENLVLFVHCNGVKCIVSVTTTKSLLFTNKMIGVLALSNQV